MLPEYCAFFNISLLDSLRKQLDSYSGPAVVYQDPNHTDCLFISDRIRRNMTYLVLSDMTWLRRVLSSTDTRDGPLSLEEVESCLDGVMKEDKAVRDEHLKEICKFLQNASSLYLSRVPTSLVLQDILREQYNVAASVSLKSSNPIELYSRKCGISVNKMFDKNARCGI